MKNRDLFNKDPLDNKLRNDGVARITSSHSDNEDATLRYELESFVCEGQYADGLTRILESFLKGLNSSSQQAVWVSGFYGSGKSHLVKMLHHLWNDTQFADGATARGIAELPDGVRDLLTELSTHGRRNGGLHAASGTLPSGGSKSVRMAVLGIICQSVGLPAGYSQARFVLWMRQHGIEKKVIESLQHAGTSLDATLDHLYTSPPLARALLQADPDFAKDEKDARATLRAQFPNIEDIDTATFIKTIRDVLGDADGKPPLSVVILDEVQIYIGSSDDRSQGIQEVAEALCKQLDSRILLIGTGQTALTAGMPLLQKFRDRFTIPIQLTDTDVETVTRRVVLQKKASATSLIRKKLDDNAGEISRHLATSRIASRPQDHGPDLEDYPLLPVRRRFWEQALRAVDVAGTASQLRSQLRIVHDAVEETAELDVGHVVSGDYFFEQQAASLLNSGILIRDHHETIAKLNDGTPAGRLAQRVCGLVWMIRKMPREASTDMKIRATADSLADLLITDLASEGPEIRKELPMLLEKLVKEGKLIKVEGDEYSLQTRESSEWDAEFRTRHAKLKGDLTSLGTKRGEFLRAACQQALGALKIAHPGSASKTNREMLLHFASTLPTNFSPAVPIWVRDGWGATEKEALAEAKKAGLDSPIVFIWIDKKGGDDLITALVDADAARGTIDSKGVPSTDAAREAQESMKSRLGDAERRRDELIREAVDAARVWVGGGSDQHGIQFKDKVLSAVEVALSRMFPRFSEADYDAAKWNSVINRAKNGDEAALDVLNYKGKPEDHPVCKAVLAAIGSGNKGRDIRSLLEGGETGWPRDAVDAALILLHTCGTICASANGSPVPLKGLDQAKISICDFTSESAPIQAGQKIKLRKIYALAGIKCSPGEETAKVPDFIRHLQDLAQRAGGPAPLPAIPDTSWLDAIRHKVGNEQLTTILAQESTITEALQNWKNAADLSSERQPRWEVLQRLLKHAGTLPEAAASQAEADAITSARSILATPDAIPSLVKTVSNHLRASLTAAHQKLVETYTAEEQKLNASSSWKSLTGSQRAELLAAESLSAPAVLNIGEEKALLDTLDRAPLSTWRTRADALIQQFARVGIAAAKLLEPKVQQLHLSSGTLKTEADVKQWLSEQEAELLIQLKSGPIVIS